MEPLSNDVLAQLFTGGRTFNHWLERPVSEQQLHELWELTKWGPTSMNCLPMRLVFLVSDQAKQQLGPALAKGNVEQTMAAPVTAIVATDHAFYEKLPELFPANPKARDLFAGKPELAAENAFRNASLQGGYLILAARALGLDCGPMSGFDAETVDRVFFPDSKVRTNFLLNIGYGDREKLHPRGPRPGFAEVASIR
jgi:nitroreductase